MIPWDQRRRARAPLGDLLVDRGDAREVRFEAVGEGHRATDRAGPRAPRGVESQAHRLDDGIGVAGLGNHPSMLGGRPQVAGAVPACRDGRHAHRPRLEDDEAARVVEGGVEQDVAGGEVRPRIGDTPMKLDMAAETEAGRLPG